MEKEKVRDMKKIYVFNNFFSSEPFKRIKVEAETILEAKKKVKEMGYENMLFIKINLIWKNVAETASISMV